MIGTRTHRYLLAIVVACASVLGVMAPASAVDTTGHYTSARDVAPPWERFAFTNKQISAGAFQVRLIRKSTRTPVRDAPVKFLATKRGGERIQATRRTNNRGYARWALPVATSKVKFLEARYYAGERNRYLTLQFCRRDGMWRQCYSG